ncbi:hypothetical protein JZ751_005121, partial [Albula glossodonta]
RALNSGHPPDPFILPRSLCIKEGRRFTNRSGARACVNPEKPWVKRIMKKLDKAASSTVSESGSGNGFKLKV